jgi:hypothetical protein
MVIKPLQLNPVSGQCDLISLNNPDSNICLTTSLVAWFVSSDSDISLKKKSKELGFVCSSKLTCDCPMDTKLLPISSLIDWIDTLVSFLQCVNVIDLIMMLSFNVSLIA